MIAKDTTNELECLVARCYRKLDDYEQNNPTLSRLYSLLTEATNNYLSCKNQLEVKEHLLSSQQR
jgi:hypothetical protein